MVVPTGVKGIPLGLATLYPTKTEMHKDTTENKRAMAPPTSPEPPGDSIELLGEISKGIQSQFIEK